MHHGVHDLRDPAAGIREADCKLIGLSIDSTYSHIAWLRTIKEKNRVQGDEGRRGDVPRDQRPDDGGLQGVRECSNRRQAARRPSGAVFIIDPEGIVRSILYYPLGNGRNIDEVLRLLTAMQLGDKHKWRRPRTGAPGR
jgi:peroxiredoxin (alkyl hydroperoxide reductase subunit C)